MMQNPEHFFIKAPKRLLATGVCLGLIACTPPSVKDVSFTASPATDNIIYTALGEDVDIEVITDTGAISVSCRVNGVQVNPVLGENDRADYYAPASTSRSGYIYSGTIDTSFITREGKNTLDCNALNWYGSSSSLRAYIYATDPTKPPVLPDIDDITLNDGEVDNVVLFNPANGEDLGGVTYSLSASSSFPSPSGDNLEIVEATGALNGSFSGAGVFSVEIVATNSTSGTVSDPKTVNITFNDLRPEMPQDIANFSFGDQEGVELHDIRFFTGGSNLTGAVYSYTVVGFDTFPEVLGVPTISIDPTTGRLVGTVDVGTPTVPDTLAIELFITATAPDGDTSDSNTFTITIFD